MRVTWDEGKDFARKYVCGEPNCAKPLTLTWQKDGYDVRCNTHPTTENFKPIRSVETAIRRGELGAPVAESLAHIEEQKAAVAGPEVSKYRGFMVGEQKDAGTRKALTQQEIQTLIEYAQLHGLNPYLNHVCMMYGRPFAEIDALFFKAHETGELDGASSRPLTLNEKAELGYEADDFAFIALVYRKGAAQPFEGRHHITQPWLETRSEKSGDYRYPTWRLWPERMTEKQAYRFAFRMAFPDWAVWEKEVEACGAES